MRTRPAEIAQKLKEITEQGLFSARSGNIPTWCPGCGYFGIHHGLTTAIHKMGLKHHEVVIVSGIGCAGRYPFFSSTYGLHTVHGRALPVATGVKLARPELTVFAVGGDGDGLGIGGGHLPHIARRNVDVNYILFDNSIYGLTKGQPSPSSPLGFKTKASPGGTKDQPLNGTLMALSYGATFVARLFAGDPEQIAEVIGQAVRHKGFAFIHVYTSCVTFDKEFKTWDHLKDWVHPLPKDHETGDIKQAIVLAMDDPFAMGVIYKKARRLGPPENGG